LALVSDFIFEKSKYLWVCSGEGRVLEVKALEIDRYLENWKIYSKI